MTGGGGLPPSERWTLWGEGRQFLVALANRSVKHGGGEEREGDANLEFVRRDERCSVQFVDAAVKRPVASVSVIVNQGNRVVFGSTESYTARHSIRRNSFGRTRRHT